MFCGVYKSNYANIKHFFWTYTRKHHNTGTWHCIVKEDPDVRTQDHEPIEIE